MNELTLPPAPNWYLSSILACANDGTVAWGARNAIVIAKATDNSQIFDYSIIERSHPEKIVSIAFCPQSKEDGSYRLVSAGEENHVKIWNSKSLSLEMKNSILGSNQKVIGVDWSKNNPSLVCFLSEEGYLVPWYTNYDSSQIIQLPKMTATCLVCCPHNSYFVAVGAKGGLIYIVDIREHGTPMYRLRGHDETIVSLSWCPVPGNIFDSTNPKELLLASGAKDRFIFLWKAGIEGRSLTQFAFPPTPLDSSTHKSKVSASGLGNYTVVCWLEPTTLLTSSPWGELYSWDLTGGTTKKFTPKLIHAKHARGLFSIAGLVHKSVEQTKETVDNKSENWRSNTNIKTIWTIGQDRQIIYCSILNDKPSVDCIIPTHGGFVYCMSTNPIDASTIAYGAGDAMIRLWNLSEPHKNQMNISTLWEKIKGKVRAVAWHPVDDKLLAFATDEGRVGTFNLSKKKPTLILYRHYHRKIIYSIGWGPAPNVKNYALYTCGDGEIVYYNPEKCDENPTPVTKKQDCTEFCWKPDYSVLALGFKDGSITFLNKHLSGPGITSYALNKSIQRLVWHPESTTSDKGLSPMKNYLAAAIYDTAITVFDVSDLGRKKSDHSFCKIVAVLNAHKEKVVCLAWSPHNTGYLVSGSFDHMAQVWKVDTQEVIATFTSHLAPINCCVWSPNPDFIITGSTDFTIRVWNYKNQKIVKSPSTMKLVLKGKKTKKKKVDETQVSNESNVALSTNENEIQNDTEYANELMNRELLEESNTTKFDKSGKKKSPKKPNYFQNHSEITRNNKLWCLTTKKVVDTLVIDTHNSESEEKKDVELPALLGNEKHFEKAMNSEKELLDTNGQFNLTTDVDLWSGNLKENLQKAMTEKRLNNYLISLSPSVSKEFWEEMCGAYANQLVMDENHHKAVSYLLCINKIEEALDVFINANLFKEAYTLASFRLDSKNPIIENILKKWASAAQKDGNFQHAVECSIKLGEFVTAAKLLERRKDMDSLMLAIDIAKYVNDLNLSLSLADKAVLEALRKSDITVAKSIIEEYPLLQYRKMQIEVFDEISKVIEDFSDEKILHWLQGSADKALLDCIKERFDKCDNNYSSLLQKNSFPVPTDKKMVQVNVSQQLALSVLASEEKLQLQHIVKALEIIVQYEKSSLLMKYICALDKRNLADPKSIFNNDKIGVAKSLRAYLCYATITWFYDNKLNETQISESVNIIHDILEKCIEDLLNKESVKFWNAESEIIELQTQLSSIIAGNLQNSNNDDTDEKKNIVEQLDTLKNNRKEYLDNRVSSPNPYISYGDVMEFISKITNEEIQQKVTELVMIAWKKATAIS